ncbi:unnamed protein product [Clavelina lepadiformis]|uniref:Peptidase metallopeptidase domain-containing protein n=1 Tax=Clavelina lepadiformis TaxID=159417 RepID=A0ABP0G0D5_CLALP
MVLLITYQFLKVFEDTKQKWNKHVLTYSIMNYTLKLAEDSVHRQIDYAFKVWSKHSKLEFEKVKRGNDKERDIKISFCQKEHGDGCPFNGSGGVVVHGLFPSSGIGGDLQFDNDENWTDKEIPAGNNLFAVAAHEMGHCLS